MHTVVKHSDSSYSPSFNSYYNADLAEIAARVTVEFPEPDESPLNHNDTEIDCQDDDEFEFDLSNLTLSEGQIRPVYPVFNRDFDPGRAASSSSSSSSSSDADEIPPPGTYCVWERNKSALASPSPGRCRKSNSTGSSVSVKAKTWKITDFLKRSKSDGLMILTPKKKKKKKKQDGGKQVRLRDTMAVREGYYGGARSKEGGENKRRSYLPYRKDLVGLFATPHPFRKMHLPPF